MKHNRAILITFAFLAILFLGDRGLSSLLQETISYSSNRFITLYNNKSKAEVLVLGNSRANRNFTEPELEQLTGKSTLNLGLGLIPTVLSEALFLDFIDHNGKPELLIIEPTNLNVDPKKVVNMRMLGFYSERIRKLIHMQNPRLHYTSAVFNLFYFNNEIFLRSFLEVFKSYTDRKLYGEIPEKLLTKLLKEKPNPDPNNTYLQNEEALIRMLEYAESHDISVRIILTPHFNIHGYGSGLFRHNWIEKLQKLIGERRIWDYSALISDKTMFKDKLHLNAKGASILHKTLINDGFFE